MPYKNPFIAKLKRKEYYYKNRKKNIAYSVRWKKEHPENRRKYDKKYRETQHYQEYHKEYMDKYNKMLVETGRKKDSDKIFNRTLKGRLAAWRAAAKIRGIEWSITLEDVDKLPLICAETGIKLVLDYKRLNTASLDRINNKKGYTKDNIRFVCWQVNRMKHILDLKNFHNIIKLIYEHNKLGEV